jgi:hypothetical protein
MTHRVMSAEKCQEPLDQTKAPDTFIHSLQKGEKLLTQLFVETEQNPFPYFMTQAWAI